MRGDIKQVNNGGLAPVDQNKGKVAVRFLGFAHDDTAEANQWRALQGMIGEFIRDRQPRRERRFDAFKEFQGGSGFAKLLDGIKVEVGFPHPEGWAAAERRSSKRCGA